MKTLLQIINKVAVCSVVHAEMKANIIKIIKYQKKDELHKHTSSLSRPFSKYSCTALFFNSTNFSPARTYVENWNKKFSRGRKYLNCTPCKRINNWNLTAQKPYKPAKWQESGPANQCFRK